MANVFKPKRSNVPSSVPTTGQLDDGELAVNSADKKIYLRDGASVVEVANFSTGGSGTEYWTQTDVGIHTLSNVGIGTTNPTSRLDVLGDASITGIITASGPVLIGSGTSTGTDNQTLQVNGGAYVSGNLGIGITNPTNLLQVTGSNNSVSMTASGRFLVGTSTSRLVGPNERVFQIESVGTSQQFLAGMSITRNATASGNFPLIALLKTRGTTFGSVDSVVQGDGLGSIMFYGADGTSSNNSGARILVTTDGPVSTGIVPGRIDFATGDTSGTLTDRLTIKSSGNIGIGTTNPNTTLDVRGPITVGVGTVGVGSIFLTNEIDAWYYTGKSKSVTTDDGSPTAVYVGAAGTALFITGDNNNRVIQYTLSTPYDVSTAGAAVTFFSTSLQETAPAGIDFNSDGTKMFIVGQTAVAPLVTIVEYVHEYSLSIPWNVSPSSVGWTTSYRITEDSSPNGVAFGDNGTKMYVIGNANDRIYQYTLTTPYSLASGVSYSGNSLLVTITNAEGTFTDLSFNSDGSKVWVTGSDRDRIYEFTLATNWDISTGSYTNDFFTELESSLFGLHVIPSQNVAYIVGTGLDTVYQFDTNNYSLKLCSDPSKNKINLGQSSSSIIFEGYARVKDNLHVRKGLYVGDASRFASFADFTGTLNHSGSTATLNNNPNANTINLSTGAAPSGVQKTINIGTGGAAGSRLLVTFGSATAGTISTVTFNPGTNLILGLTTAIPTGTASQPLQIGSASSIQGAYISGSVGIGITNPQGSLQVGTGVTVYGTTGIVSAVSFYGSGTNLSGIVTQIVAGSNVTISPIDGTGSVTINSTSSGGSGGGIEIRDDNTIIGNGVTAVNFAGSGISTITVNSGIATVTIPAGIGTVREFLFTSGTTYTPTTGTTHVMVYATGGGGGGGNASGTDTSNSSVGAGGGAGGTAIKLYTVAEIGASASYSIGGGGTGGTTAGETGGTGGTTTFTPSGGGATLTANGGVGGTGNSTAATAVYANGGTGGTATGGDINARGQSGFAVGSVAAFAGGGNGGASFYAGGGEGGYVITNTSQAGLTATTYGAGGGGGASRNLNNAGAGGASGGDGGSGVIFIVEYGT